jgi:hypothetical protein
MNESNGDINFFAKMMDKDSELQSQISKKPKYNQNISLCDSSPKSELKYSPKSSSSLKL